MDPLEPTLSDDNRTNADKNVEVGWNNFESSLRFVARA